MPRRVGKDDHWDDDAADSTDDDEQFDDLDESEAATIPCPYCRRQIHEDSQRCPYCEQYVTEEDALPTRKPWWLLIGVFVCLYVVYRWIAG
jgi:hypothetical protein